MSPPPPAASAAARGPVVTRRPPRHASRWRRAAVALPRPSLRALPTSVPVQRLFHGRAAIAVLGAGLLGLVFLQVSLLKLNSAISINVERAAKIERENAQTRASISKLDAGRRVQSAAGQLGMVMPAAGAICFLDAEACTPLLRRRRRCGRPGHGPGRRSADDRGQRPGCSGSRARSGAGDRPGARRPAERPCGDAGARRGAGSRRRSAAGDAAARARRRAGPRGPRHRRAVRRARSRRLT